MQEVYEVKEVGSAYLANDILSKGGWTVLHVYTRPSALPLYSREEVDVVYVMARTRPHTWEIPNGDGDLIGRAAGKTGGGSGGTGAG